MPEETVTITIKEYEELKRAAEMLYALEAGGVDNWEWYSESVRHLLKDDEDDDLED